MYIGALGRSPNSTEQQQGMDSLTTAGAQSQAALLTASRTIAQSLFDSTEYAQRNRTDAQFVTTQKKSAGTNASRRVVPAI